MNKRLAQVEDDIAISNDELSKVFQDKADELALQAIEGLDRQMGMLREGFDQVSTEFRRRLHDLDNHVHERPYVYLLGAGLLGLGASFYFKVKASRLS